jgi:hypothetical protein
LYNVEADLIALLADQDKTAARRTAGLLRDDVANAAKAALCP